MEITADRRILLDLPTELPLGMAEVTVASKTEKLTLASNEAAQKLRGLAKKMGSTITVERFLEMRKEDTLLEEERHRRLFPTEGDL